MALDTKLLDEVAKTFNVQFPKAESMEGYLDIILPKIKQWGEDLREQSHYVGRHWIEIRDDDDFHDTILHIFNPEEEYLRSINGDLFEGDWRHLGNKLVVGKLIEKEIHGEEASGQVYQLAFMDGEFLILKKHGDQIRLKQPKYLVLMLEGIASKFTWREAMEYLFNKYKDQDSSWLIVAIVVLLIAAIFLVLSTY